MKNIAVEKGLSNVKEYLTIHGFNVDEISSEQKNSKDFIDGFDAVVISGMDTNLLGIHSTVAKTSVIEANGMTPEDVRKEIEKRLG